MALDSLRRLTLVVEIENRFRICLDTRTKPPSRRRDLVT